MIFCKNMELQERNGTNTSTSSKQSSQERKLYYRQLLNQIEGLQESNDYGIQVIEDIGDIIKKVTEIESQHNISERLQYPDETLLDCMVLSSASSILVKCIEAVDVDTSTYEASDFAQATMNYCATNVENLDFTKLLPFAQKIIPELPKYSSIYGSYDMNNLPAPKPRKERQKTQREVLQRKAPEKVTSLEKEEQGIEEIVTVLFDVLSECYKRNGDQSIKYYEYVIDTESFSNTVENMFYCSFLIRDGRAHLDLDGGIPYIKPVTKRALKQFRDEGGINSQIITAITIAEWETFKKPGWIQRYRKTKK